jgi:hypothetical protein
LEQVVGHQSHLIFLEYFVVLSTQTTPFLACVCETQKRFMQEDKKVWDGLSTELPNRSEIIGWINHGVSAYENLQGQLLRNCIRTLTLLKILSSPFHH